MKISRLFMKFVSRINCGKVTLFWKIRKKSLSLSLDRHEDFSGEKSSTAQFSKRDTFETSVACKKAVDHHRRLFWLLANLTLLSSFGESRAVPVALFSSIEVVATILFFLISFPFSHRMTHISISEARVINKRSCIFFRAFFSFQFLVKNLRRSLAG